MPTKKQGKVAKILAKEPETPFNDAMIQAGYAVSTSKKPQNLTKSKSWPELIEKYLPDKLLAKRHKELLNVPRKIRTYIKGDLQTETEEMDTQAVGKALDLAYKIKNKFPSEKSSGDTNIAVINIIRFGEDKKRPIEVNAS